MSSSNNSSSTFSAVQHQAKALEKKEQSQVDPTTLHVYARSPMDPLVAFSNPPSEADLKGQFGDTKPVKYLVCMPANSLKKEAAQLSSSTVITKRKLAVSAKKNITQKECVTQPAAKRNQQYQESPHQVSSDEIEKVPPPKQTRFSKEAVESVLRRGLLQQGQACPPLQQADSHHLRRAPLANNQVNSKQFVLPPVSNRQQLQPFEQQQMPYGVVERHNQHQRYALPPPQQAETRHLHLAPFANNQYNKASEQFVLPPANNLQQQQPFEQQQMPYGVVERHNQHQRFVLPPANNGQQPQPFEQQQMAYEVVDRHNQQQGYVLPPANNLQQQQPFEQRQMPYGVVERHNQHQGYVLPPANNLQQQQPFQQQQMPYGVVEHHNLHQGYVLPPANNGQQLQPFEQQQMPYGVVERHNQHQGYVLPRHPQLQQLQQCNPPFLSPEMSPMAQQTGVQPGNQNPPLAGIPTVPMNAVRGEQMPQYRQRRQHFQKDTVPQYDIIDLTD